MQVKDHAMIVYQGIWKAIPSIGAVELLSRVSSALTKDGFAIKDSSSDAGFLQSTAVPFLGASLEPFKVSIKLQVVNGVGFATEDDILSIIHHDYYMVTNEFPQSDTIPTVQNPNQTARETGQGELSNAPKNKDNGDFFGLGSLFSGFMHFFSDAKILLIGLGIGLIAAVMLVTSRRV